MAQGVRTTSGSQSPMGDADDAPGILPDSSYRGAGEGQSPPPLLARRDALGFLTDSPALSQDQVSWLICRLRCDNDRDATTAAALPMKRVRAWRNDPGFVHTLEVALADQREAFRLIGSQLLPRTLQTLETLYEMASEGNLRAAQIAMTMHLRSQGLLIDRTSSDESSKVDQLITMLRESRPVQVLDMTPRP
jgi:hypothetical protein